MFTHRQYETIRHLQLGMTQLEPDGNNCVICGDSGHQAFECGHNPLRAMALCGVISQQSEALHESLHWLAGFDSRMGEQVGPSAVVMPLSFEAWCDEVDRILTEEYEFVAGFTTSCGRENFRQSYDLGDSPDDEVQNQLNAV